MDIKRTQELETSVEGSLEPKEQKNTAMSLAAQTSQPRLARGAKKLKGEIQEQVKGKPGQPTKFTPEVWEKILEHIAGYGDLIEICSLPDMPAVSTVQRWYRGNEVLYDQMRAAWYDHSMLGHAANINILRGGALSTGDWRRDEALVQENRWFMGKTNRRDFGDKVQVDVVAHQVFVLPGDAIEGQGY